ncbi:hypothetical protein DY000_02040726 [Brassica cretica]|uniref:Uncharacterized protein n=1 Tax=Brassica cretica TaxID=69181 RepID=A0ABQ7BL77_BRACR|nr:hypothetical protein DY000_02040726 [Brassica cretica]
MPPALGQSASCSRSYAHFTEEWSGCLARGRCRGDEGLSIDITALVSIDSDARIWREESIDTLQAASIDNVNQASNDTIQLVSDNTVHHGTVHHGTVHYSISINTVHLPSINTVHPASIDTVHPDTIHRDTIHSGTVHPNIVHPVKNNTSCGETEKIEVLILEVDENGMLRDEECRTRNSAEQLINAHRVVILDVIVVAEMNDFDLSREWYDWVGQDPFQGLPHQDPRNHIEEL